MPSRSLAPRGVTRIEPLPIPGDTPAAPGVADTRWVRPIQGDTVTYYRIYLLDHNDRIVTGSDTDCQNDEAALVWAATTLGTDARAEVWQGTRCLGRVSNVFIPLDLGQAHAAIGD